MYIMICAVIFLTMCLLILFCRISREVIPQKQLKQEAEFVMEQLMTLVQHTAVSLILCLLIYEGTLNYLMCGPFCTQKWKKVMQKF